MNISIDFNRDFAVEKSLSILMIFLLVLPLSSQQTFLVMIIAALGHFFLADIYRMKKKSPEKWHFLAYFTILATAFILSYSYTTPFMIFATAFFMCHCFWDEHKLNGKEPDILSTALVIMIVSVQSFWIINDLYALNLYQYLSLWIALSGFIVLTIAVHMASQSRLKIHTNTILFGLAHLVFVAAYFCNILPPGMEVTRWVIIFHGSSWYIHLARRYYNEDQQKFKIYLRDVIGMISLLIIGYLLYKMWKIELNWLHTFFYSPQAYFAWAIVHLITTLRVSDYRYMIPVRQKIA